MSDAGEGGTTSNAINGGFFLSTVIQGRDITVQLPPTVTPALGGLEAPSPAFTGRTTDLEAVLKVLAPGGSLDGGPQAVLVSAVSGMAGVGKTELAKKAGAEAWKERGWFSGGVLFTDLAGYDPERRLTPERALEGLLRALAIPGEHIPNGLEDRQRLYRSVLAAYAKESRRILVIIDNASTADQVSPLLPADGINAALVTSRHTLAIVGARLHDLNVLETTEAVEMLGAELRVARGDGDTRITQALGQAAKIADLCAYLPLALNIAASLLAENDTVAEDGTMDYTAADLASDLEAEHTRLDELSYEERAVRAAFDLSYRRLDQQQARLFRLFPLNPGPSISSEATAHLADLEVRNARHLLTRLARAHLIERRSGRRWAMHDLVRLYADEHGRTYAAPDQRDSARTRLFAHYQDTAEAANTHLDTTPGPRAPHFPDRAAALQWLDAEHASLTATATAAPALGHPATTTALAFSLARYLDYRRYFDDWITLTTTTLAICRELGDRHREGQTLNNLGIALREVRRFEKAIDANTQATTVFRELRDRHGEGAALNDLGIALREVRRFEEAIEVHTQATDIARELRDRHGEGTALSNLGIALMEVRRFEEAIDAHTQATTVFRELGDRHSAGIALNNLGLALVEVRRFEEAIDAHTQATDIARELGDRHREGQRLNNLGLALMEVRRFEEAIDANTQATTVFRELRDRHGEGAALSNLGIALREVQRLGEAIEVHAQATDIARELGDRHREGQTLNNLGIALRVC
ncbi:tetratricopeptide repeat protein, partial [Streptomyces sp. NPDC058642]|uniref:tetratricopeptide repeat protein n=1 Tax=Streptomyces sp. NPDC058642 TaxID=3346572 RepID=UPI003660DA69